LYWELRTVDPSCSPQKTAFWQEQSFLPSHLDQSTLRHSMQLLSWRRHRRRPSRIRTKTKSRRHVVVHHNSSNSNRRSNGPRHRRPDNSSVRCSRRLAKSAPFNRSRLKDVRSGRRRKSDASNHSRLRQSSVRCSRRGRTVRCSRRRSNNLRLLRNNARWSRSRARERHRRHRRSSGRGSPRLHRKGNRQLRSSARGNRRRGSNRFSRRLLPARSHPPELLRPHSSSQECNLSSAALPVRPASRRNPPRPSSRSARPRLRLPPCSRSLRRRIRLRRGPSAPSCHPRRRTTRGVLMTCAALAMRYARAIA
jgi:hypothetical protein